jgi:hypothetical protein
MGLVQVWKRYAEYLNAETKIQNICLNSLILMFMEKRSGMNILATDSMKRDK